MMWQKLAIEYKDVSSPALDAKGIGNKLLLNVETDVTICI